jgi:hypothetical protein
MSISPITDNMQCVPAGELQGNIGCVNTPDFTRIFTLELTIHADSARIPNSKLGLQAQVMQKRTTERDILDRSRVILISQFKYAYLFGIEPFM